MESFFSLRTSMKCLLFMVILLSKTNALQYFNTACQEDPKRDLHFEGNVRNLKPGESKSKIHYPSTSSSKLQMVCYEGQPKRKLQLLWTSVRLRLDISEDATHSVYHGPNISQVVCQHHQALGSWLNLLPWRTQTIYMSLFNHTCVGVYTAAPFSFHFEIKDVDYWLVLWLLIGLFLCLFAHRLSKNVLFYYTTGISFGLLASILIVVFILSRFVPKKAGGYVVLLGGWSVTLYLIQCLWDNINWLLEKYSLFVGIYFASVGLISFGVLYYKGPVSSPRALDLIKWSLQLMGVLFIYNGTQIVEVSAAIIFVLILRSFWPARMTRALQYFWVRMFPPRIKLLTAEEYDRQAEKSTREALENLREYCRSPDCDTWRTVSRLKGPHRFSKWVEGNSLHVTDDEVIDYDSDPCPQLPKDEYDYEDEMDFTLGSQ